MFAEDGYRPNYVVGTHDKNLAPMASSSLSPEQIMIGRNPIMETLEGRPLCEMNDANKEKASMQIQLQTMLHARTAIIKADAERILRIGLTRPLRAFSKVEYRVNDIMRIILKTPGPKEEKRICGYTS